MKRWLEGQIIACIRSNEMAARLQREAMENKWSNATFERKNHEPIILLYIHRSQESPTFHSICRGPEIPPTNRSMIARFRMSRYARRRWSWRCFANTMIVKRLKMTMIRDSVVIRTTHGMQAGAERGAEVGVSLVLVSIRLRVAYHNANQTWKFTKKNSKNSSTLFLTIEMLDKFLTDAGRQFQILGPW